MSERESLLTSVEYLTIHSIPVDQLYTELSSSSDGLRSDTSKEIRARVGYNKVPPPLSAPAWLCCLLPCLLRTKAMMEYNECIPEWVTYSYYLSPDILRKKTLLLSKF